MKKPVLLISVLLFGAILLVLAQCGAIGFTYEWHQKITVTVEGPDGPISGSSVQLMLAKPVMLVNSSKTHSPGLHGEAVIVELPQKRYLFVLLPDAWNISRHSAALYGKELEAFGASKVADNAVLASWSMGWVSKMGKLAGLPAKPIAEKYYPLLVTFDDINDPASVKRVNPDDLDASFGCPPSPSNAGAGQAAQSDAQNERGSSGGTKAAEEAAAQRPRGADASNEIGASGVSANKPCYTLKSITLEITDEPVTEGKVESVLGWWCDFRAKYLVDRYAENVINDFARELGGSHLKNGECK